MDRKNIIKKLRNFLHNHPQLKEECEVIYLMVEIRKILEYGGNPYKTLRFYCNWVLHKELSQEKTTKLLSDMFEQDIDCEKCGHENARKMISYNANFFKLGKFKNELINFFKEHNLPMDLLNKNWWIFGKLLLEIIKECPVHFVSNKIKGLEIIKYDDRKFGYKFSLIGSRNKLVIKLKLK